MATEGQIRSAIVHEARKRLGSLYRDSSVRTNWPPDQFDCSVFAHWLWSMAGVDIDKAKRDTTWPQPEPKRWSKYPGYTLTQVAALRRAGCEIPFSKIEPGDLLYYSSGSSHHVVVYVGDGKVIHAAGHAYGVILSPVVGPGKVGHGGKRLIGCFSPIVLARALGVVKAEAVAQPKPKPAPAPAPTPPAAKPLPVVAYSNLGRTARAGAIKKYRRQGFTEARAKKRISRDVLTVQRALHDYVGLDYRSGPGTWGLRTSAAWRKAKRKSGKSGTALLAALGKKYGFRAAR